MKRLKDVRIKRKTQVILTVSLIAQFTVMIVCSMFFFRPVIVSGPSMEPTLHGGDVLFMRRVLDPSMVKHGDIVTTKSGAGGVNESLIKRATYLPGETVEHNAVYSTPAFEGLVLADDEIFIVGDNHAVSNDSWVFGPVKTSDLNYVAISGPYKMAVAYLMYLPPFILLIIAIGIVMSFNDNSSFKSKKEADKEDVEPVSGNE